MDWRRLCALEGGKGRIGCLYCGGGRAGCQDGCCCAWMGEGLRKQDTGSKHSTWQPRRSLWNGAVARARRQLLAPVLASVRSETLVRRDRAPISKSDRPELALLQPWGVSSALPLADVAGQTAIVAGNQFARARRRACRVWW